MKLLYPDINRIFLLFTGPMITAVFCTSFKQIVLNFHTLISMLTLVLLCSKKNEGDLNEIIYNFYLIFPVQTLMFGFYVLSSMKYRVILVEWILLVKEVY